MKLCCKWTEYHHVIFFFFAPLYRPGCMINHNIKISCDENADLFQS